ncbi:MAG: hypothetical protein J6386_02050 [Candidatus Synoicihabitans palmerolidicus]|nr:hypothetical protein [Candidatus Synoicihabitans palmerolidicus]
MNNTTEAVAPEVSLQTWLRPDLTPVGPNKDYAAFRDQRAGRRRGRVAATPAVRAQGAAGAGIAHDARKHQFA